MVVFLIWIYQNVWRQPLGPSLATPFGLPSTWTPDPPLSTPGAGSVPYALSAPEGVTKTPGICGGLSPMYILVVGSDSRGDNYLYGLADVIRLVRVDFVNAKVTVLEFPRDLWVQIPDIADNLNGQDHEKLNQAYLYGNPASATRTIRQAVPACWRARSPSTSGHRSTITRRSTCGPSKRS
jgi:hypothetical protein